MMCKTHLALRCTWRRGGEKHGIATPKPEIDLVMKRLKIAETLAKETQK
jgi:hypothetical protein